MPHTTHEHVSFYRKRPVVIEAVRWDPMNPQPILDWLTVGGAQYRYLWPLPMFHSQGASSMTQKSLHIVTLEGEMEVRPGAYIIRGIRGEYYPCEGSIFEETYEVAGGEGDGSA